MNRTSSFSKDRRYRYDKGTCEGSHSTPICGGSIHRCAICDQIVQANQDGTARKHLRITQIFDNHTRETSPWPSRK